MLARPGRAAVLIPDDLGRATRWFPSIFQDSGEPAWVVKIAAAASHPLRVRDREVARVTVVGREILVEPLENTEDMGLAVARAVWAVALNAEGGVLVHAAGVVCHDQAVVLTGPPDAGKSTGARLALEAGGELLSDEILAFFPDGTVQGTPFRSDLLVAPSPRRVRCAAVLLLEKAPWESVRIVPPALFARSLLSQVYAPKALGLSLSRARSIALRCADHAFRGTFSFRKDPAAGRFLLEWLDAL